MTMGIPEEKIKELQEAAKKLGKAMGGKDTLKTFDLMGARMRQLYVMDFLLKFMDDTPEYRNQYLLEDMKEYLDSMIVEAE